jgi:ribosome-binding protein aMBF1 (putative translation factor)
MAEFEQEMAGLREDLARLGDLEEEERRLRKRIGERLADTRGAAGMSQSDLARVLYEQPKPSYKAFVSQVENGHRGTPETYSAFANAIASYRGDAKRDVQSARKGAKRGTD